MNVEIMQSFRNRRHLSMTGWRAPLTPVPAPSVKPLPTNAHWHWDADGLITF